MFSSGKFLPTPSASSDPYFNYTTLLLKDTGTNGAQNNTFTPDYIATPITSSVPGGYAVYLNGSSYLTTAFSSVFNFGTGDFTVECWVNLSAISGVRGILGTHGSYTGGGWGFYANNGVITFQVFPNGSTAADTAYGATLSTGTWAHIAAVRNSGSLKVYVNGIGGTAISSTNNGDNSTGFYVGAYEGTYFKLTGYISNVHVVKGVAVYTSNFTTPTPPLTAISGTSILTCQSATIIDNSVNNFTITNNGGASVVTSIGGSTAYGNATQGSFNPYMPTGYWSGYFDGSGDYVSVPSNAAFEMGTGNFTIECWFYIIGDSAQDQSSNRSAELFSNIYWTGFGFGNGYELAVSGNSTTTGTGLAFINRSGSAYSISYTGTISQRTWHHIAVVRSGTTTKIYFNGTSVASGTLGGQYMYSGSPMWIGRQNLTSPNVYPHDFNGYISNLRFVKGTAVYTSNFTPSTTPLTAITNTSLLCLQDNRFKDNSSNAFTLTRNGDAKIAHFNPFAPTGSYTTTTYGGSVYLDGSGDYLTFPASTDYAFGTGDFTVECWIYPTSTSASRITTRLPSTGQSGSWGFNFSSSTFAFSEVVIGEPGVSATGLPPMLNTWTHLAASRQGTTLRLFANGVLVGSGTISTNYNYSGSPLGIGATNPVGGGETYFPGYISNLRIVKGTAVYTGAFTPPSSPVTAVANTVLLLNSSNAGIYDATAINDIETAGSAQANTTIFKYGSSSVKFNGTSDYLTIPGSNLISPSGNFTVEFWCYPASATSAGQETVTLQSNTSSYASVRILWKTNGIMHLLLSTDGSTWAVNTSGASGGAPYNQWTHVALVRNGSSFVLYLNGTSYISFTLSSALYAGPTTLIGSVYYYGYVNFFNGFIDELRITNGVARYTSNFTVPTAAFPTR